MERKKMRKEKEKRKEKGKGKREERTEKGVPSDGVPEEGIGGVAHDGLLERLEGHHVLAEGGEDATHVVPRLTVYDKEIGEEGLGG